MLVYALSQLAALNVGFFIHLLLINWYFFFGLVLSAYYFFHTERKNIFVGFVALLVVIWSFGDFLFMSQWVLGAHYLGIFLLTRFLYIFLFEKHMSRKWYYPILSLQFVGSWVIYNLLGMG